jgi:hypothetical protein
MQTRLAASITCVKSLAAFSYVFHASGFERFTARVTSWVRCKKHACVIGHEVGHHVQNLLGIIDKVDAERERGSPELLDNKVRLRLLLRCVVTSPARPHVPKYQNPVQLRTAGDRRGDSRGVTAIRAKDQRIHEAIKIQ